MLPHSQPIPTRINKFGWYKFAARITEIGSICLLCYARHRKIFPKLWWSSNNSLKFPNKPKWEGNSRIELNRTHILSRSVVKRRTANPSSVGGGRWGCVLEWARRPLRQSVAAIYFVPVLIAAVQHKQKPARNHQPLPQSPPLTTS